MRKAASLFLAALMAIPAGAQGIGLIGSAGIEKQVKKGMDAGFEAEYRLADNFKSTDRWSVGLSLSKRLYRNQAKTFTVKASAGYKLIQAFEGYSTKYKGKTAGYEDGEEPQYYINHGQDFNLTPSYKVLRHRATASVQAALELGRFKISLRECYQYQHADSVEVIRDKYRFDGYGKLKTTKDYVYKGKMDKAQLRSRIGLDFDIPHCKFDPFVSFELYSNLQEGMSLDKTKLTAGVDYTFKKKHGFELAYIYQNKSDDDEPGGSYVSLGYTFKF